MSLTQPKSLKQSNLSDPSIFSVLPSPFQTVLVINAAQHRQAIQKVSEIDQEVRNAGGTYRELNVILSGINLIITFYFFII